MVSVWVGAVALVVAAGLAAAGGRSLRGGMDGWRRARDLEAATTASVGDAAPEEAPPDERVTVTGSASPVVGTLQAPFSEERALVVDWSVAERSLSGWRHAGDGVDAVPFAVEDDTGRALVWPTPGAVALDDPDSTLTVAGDGTAPDPVRRFLAREDAPDADGDDRLGLGGPDTRRYAESRIEPGDEVTVVGRPRPVPSGDHAREADPAAPDGGRPAVSVADADVTVAFGPPWNEHDAPEDDPVGLTPGAARTPRQDTDDTLLVTDRSPERLAERHDDATRRIAVGAGLLLAAVALAGLGAWTLVG